MLGLVASLAITLGLALIALHLLRRLQGVAAPRGRGLPLQLIQRVSTGHRQGVALLRVGERVLVLSVNERGAQLLTELTGEDLIRALSAESPTTSLPAGAAAVPAASPVRSARAGRPAPRLLLFGRALLVALFLVGAGRLSAQQPAAQQPAAQQPAPQTPAAAAPAPKTQSAVVQTPRPHSPKVAPATAPGLKPPTVLPPAPPKIEFQIGDGAGGLKLSGTVGLVVFMGAMTLLPAMFLLMTSFTRILIVLHFLRSAIGTQTTPPGQLLVAIAVLLTGVVMNPVLQRANTDAIQPYLDGKIGQVDAYKAGVAPLREFMLANTRDQDLAMFADLSGATDVKSLDDLPTVTIVSAFVTSELRTAFQMGFVIFLPFIIVDLIVASVLMSMGMFMLPPVMISLPFKLLLFVLADGWTLVVKNLVTSFKV